MRVGRLGVLLALALSAAPWIAMATPVTAETRKNSYMFGLKCYVANAVSASDARFNANGSGAAAFKASGQKSYQVIWGMGRSMGKSDALIQEDIDSYENLLRDAYLRNDAFFLRVRYECTRIGLM